MSILGSIMSGIFGEQAHAAKVPPSVLQSTAKSEPETATIKSAPSIDIAASLDKLAAGQKDIDWRRSIVDLMKMLKLDSSLAARKKLAEELHYTGSVKDTVAMNTWLHKQVMAKLAENGGKLPNDVLHS
ncbi:MAG TPA: DUF3597 domain-containing protein [Hyphomicrobium sp.]|jgi:N-acetyl-beta-hexosaminidase|nr:DUF3597 domain-containing protein [Hyphomicrobium sp.]HVZ04478.1 DUF3597 domain-containing protein [Hyphomicrobium sp.]